MAESSMQDMALFGLFNGCNIRALSKLTGLPRPEVFAAILRAEAELQALVMRVEEGASLSARQRVRLELLQAAAREPGFPQDPARDPSALQSPPFAGPSQIGASAWRAGPSASNRTGTAG